MTDLMPHQIEDSTLLAAGDDLPNFSEAGTGKTWTTLEGVKKAGFNGGLVVAPSIALPMWKEEIETYLGASANIIKTGKSPLGGHDFNITSYGLAANVDLRSRLRHQGGDVMILDEAHYLKTATSARHKAIFGPASNGRGGLYDAFDQTWQLTGTPIMRHADDLWAQLRATQPDVLRDYDVLTYEKFVRKFCFSKLKKFHPRMAPQMVVVGSMNGDVLNKMLYEEIGAMRRLMADVGKDMPPISYRNVWVKVKKSATLDGALRSVPLSDLEGALSDPDGIMAKMWRLLGELKVPGCVDYLMEEAIHGPMLLGYWHTDTGDAIAEQLRRNGKSVGRVQGSTPMGEREDIRVAFNEGKLDFIVGQISSMNVSWNLQKCGNRVVILEDHFSPGLIEQFIKRVWRFGQENHVQVDFIKTDNALDDAFTKVRTSKSAYSSAALD